MRSHQTSLGVQHDLGHDLVLKVDWARRQFENVDLGELDLNRFNRPSGPVIPKCAVLPDFNPADRCSNGSMTFWVPQGRSIYEAMLLEVDKRLSNHFQFATLFKIKIRWWWSQCFSSRSRIQPINLDRVRWSRSNWRSREAETSIALASPAGSRISSI